MKHLKTLVSLALALPICAIDSTAQELNATYITEIQSDFQDKSNWLNHLRLDFSMDIAKNLRFDAATLSVAQTNGAPIMGDIQTFSNIEADNMTLALAMLGVNWTIGKSELFFGVHNMNENFFTSPGTALFTNSSCGIFPTLGLDYAIANFPLASMGVAYTLHLDRWRLQTSLYNGVGYNDFTGRDNVFRICPQSDGLFSVSQVSYETNGSGYYIGMAHRDAKHENEEEIASQETEKSLHSVYWAYAEQRITDRLHLIAQYSINPSADNGCRNYAALGTILKAGDTEGGLIANYADCTTEHEWTVELTWKIPFSDKGYIQPALHYFNNSHTEDVVGLLRLGYEL